MKTLFTALLICGTAYAAHGAPPPTQPHPSLKCTDSEAEQIVEKRIKAIAASVPNATDYVSSMTVSGERDSKGYASAADFSYALVDRDGKVVGLGLETLNGECEDQGGTLTWSTSGPLPVKPLN